MYKFLDCHVLHFSIWYSYSVLYRTFWSDRVQIHFSYCTKVDYQISKLYSFFMCTLYIWTQICTFCTVVSGHLWRQNYFQPIGAYQAWQLYRGWNRQKGGFERCVSVSYLQWPCRPLPGFSYFLSLLPLRTLYQPNMLVFDYLVRWLNIQLSLWWV